MNELEWLRRMNAHGIELNGLTAEEKKLARQLISICEESGLNYLHVKRSLIGADEGYFAKLIRESPQVHPSSVSKPSRKADQPGQSNKHRMSSRAGNEYPSSRRHGNARYQVIATHD